MRRHLGHATAGSPSRPCSATSSRSGYTDLLLGRALDRLRATGVYDRALIVVLADHGASFRAGEPHRAATAGNLPDIAGIPLFVKAPGPGTRAHLRCQRAPDRPASHAGRPARRAAAVGHRRPTGRPGAGGRQRSALQAQRGGPRPYACPSATYVRRRDALVRADRRPVRTSASGPVELDPMRTSWAGASMTWIRGSRRPRASASTPAICSADVQPEGARGARADLRPDLRAVRAHGARSGARGPGGGHHDALPRTAMRGASPRSSRRERWRDGANSVDLIAVTGCRRRAGASSGCAGWSVTYRLAQEGDRQVIVDPARAPDPGRPVGPDRLRGSALAGRHRGDRARMGGRHRAPAGGRARGGLRRQTASSGRRSPRSPREDLVRKFGPELSRAGFELSGLTAGPKPGSPAAPVQVFAILDGRASPVPQPGAP